MITSALQLRDMNRYHNGFTVMWQDTELLLVEWFPYKKSLLHFKTIPISCKKHWAIPDELFTKPTLTVLKGFLKVDVLIEHVKMHRIFEVVQIDRIFAFRHMQEVLWYKDGRFYLNTF